MYDKAIELLKELANARPLLLYGDKWIERINDVLKEHDSEAEMPAVPAPLAFAESIGGPIPSECYASKVELDTVSNAQMIETAAPSALDELAAPAFAPPSVSYRGRGLQAIIAEMRSASQGQPTHIGALKVTAGYLRDWADELEVIDRHLGVAKSML